MPNIWTNIRQRMRRKFTSPARGVVRTGWTAGNGIAVAIPAGMADWNQNWREPLREALDWLRDKLAPRL